jgi:hypothetical protein
MPLKTNLTPKKSTKCMTEDATLRVVNGSNNVSSKVARSMAVRNLNGNELMAVIGMHSEADCHLQTCRH